MRLGIKTRVKKVEKWKIMTEQVQTMSEKEQEIDRTKRVKQLKKIICIVLLLLILLPSVLCMILFVRMSHLEKQLDKALEVRTSRIKEQKKVESEQLAEQKEQKNPVTITKTDPKQELPLEEQYQNFQKIYLTFDDGPSSYTDEILDILKEYDVKATFFVVGKEQPQYRKLYQRIVEEGHSLGMHSYSHKYDEIYRSVPAFEEDMKKLQDFLYQTTQIRPTLLRFPGGSSNKVSRTDMQEMIAYVEKAGVTYFDWNISSGDAKSGMLSAQQIFQNSISGLGNYQEQVILMHDSSDKRTTVEALPLIIERILEQENTVILPITADTKPIQHIKTIQK